MRKEHEIPTVLRLPPSILFVSCIMYDRTTIFQNSNLEIFICCPGIGKLLQRELNFKLMATERQCEEISRYFSFLNTESLIAGLKFAYNRQIAKDKGYLMLGRKSKVKRETNVLTAGQAKWRLSNWKSMIKTYRDKGYSYPTISRIKKEIRKIALGRNGPGY